MNNGNLIVYSLIAGAATMLGTGMLFYKEAWARKNSIYLVSFSAGVMLAAAFLHLIPEAVSLSEEALLAALCGILAFYVLQQAINFHPCYDEQCRLHNMGILSLIGLTFHSLLDGVAIALGFGVGGSLGIMTTTAVVLHQLPEGITTTSILMYAKMPRVKIMLYSIMVGAATPLGAIFFYPYLKDMPGRILGIFLAVAAGSFIYIASADLIPQTHKAQNRLNALILLSGVLFLGLIGRLMR